MKKHILKDKLIVLTGSSSGIGKELTKLLIDDFGAKVLGVARSREKLENLTNELANKQNFSYLIKDVSIKETFSEIKNYLVNENLTPFMVINCAGILPPFAKFSSEQLEWFEKTINTNFFSAVYSASELLPLLNQNEKKGYLINVSSSSALCPFSGTSIYSASKCACDRFTASISAENKKVSVVSVMPGFTKTDIMRSQKVVDNKSLIDKFSSNPKKVAKTIIKKSLNGKKRIIIGVDAHFMNLLYKTFPNRAPKIITWFLKKSKMKLFEEI